MRIVREIGLAIPVFIKWDDAEYALRARAAGYPTVSMPGVAAWHVPWLDKNDAQDWQAYYHLRNRVVTALLHSPLRRAAARWSPRARNGSSRTCCPCSTRRPRCGCWPSRTS